ncbi:MAG: hypothetical protein ACTSW1_10095 [Candidatus Hodarchaeales archaeon]
MKWKRNALTKSLLNFYSEPSLLARTKKEVSEFYALCRSPSSRNISKFFKFLSSVFFVILGWILGLIILAIIFNQLEISVLLLNLGFVFFLSSSVVFQKIYMEAKI